MSKNEMDKPKGSQSHIITCINWCIHVIARGRVLPGPPSPSSSSKCKRRMRSVLLRIPFSVLRHCQRSREFSEGVASVSRVGGVFLYSGKLKASKYDFNSFVQSNQTRMRQKTLWVCFDPRSNLITQQSVDFSKEARTYPVTNHIVF